VGIFRNPPVILKSGDILEAGIDGIGVIRNQLARDRG
ncbi:5-carboxymethyl-2-hydroxymuconate isomerase, partial [Candidatus Sumerlaeota bacterium]|nr:5-carboxymethyl-2-hydroxymuconate isomerase [Candidatus Sumerlaeota bacterium]